jgi:hypothetical protein
MSAVARDAAQTAVIMSHTGLNAKGFPAHALAYRVLWNILLC